LIHDLKPYPAYKDSGVPWLGEVPEHWDVRRNGRLFAQRNETAFPDLPILEVSLKTGVRVRSFDTTSRKQLMSDRDKYKRACRGDIAYNMMRMWQGAVGVAPVDGLVSPAYVVARPFSGTVARYFDFLFRTADYMGEVNNFSRGIVSDRNRLYWDDFKQIASPYPAPEEQSAIVRFLDHADLRIRRYISAKKKLIALLIEQKQAVIHRAVTRGLAVNLHLKPSGVESLGDVPVHWRVCKLRHCGAIEGGLTPSMEVRQYWDGDVPWVTPKDMKSASISDSSVRVTDTALQQTSLRKMPVGSVLLVVRGMILARRVPIAWTTAEVTINQDMKALKPREGVHAQFLAHLLDSAQAAFTPLIDEAGHGTRRLPTERWRDLAVVLPPAGEQVAIIRHLEEATVLLNQSIDTAQGEINLLNEYRTRLIADVVTGKLDVREAAARLPREAEEAEPFEGEELEEDGEEGRNGDLAEAGEEAVA
jgi:type I restriction enzyme S subunit